jgi:shikimate dehydrogenase
MEYGLIGEKLSHSYSKQIHELIGDYRYEIKNIAPDDLSAFFVRRDFKGINVTIPYKKSVIPFCDTLSSAAQRLGSVNTITADKDGRLHGDNTDYFGFTYMAQKAGISLQGKNVLVLGSGGTGITVEAVAHDAGAAKVTVVTRGGRVNYSNVYDLCGDTQIVINATPVGMYPITAASPVVLEKFPNCCGVLDVIYNPLFSRLLQQAKQLGIPFANGLSMLAAQAKRAADLFFGQEVASKNSIDEIVSELTLHCVNLVLIGMPGSGKTTIGKALAKLTGKVFTDTDELVECEAGMKTTELFKRSGEEHFRNMEAAAIEKVGKEKDLVIATGGGAVLRPENCLNIKQNGFVVCIRRDPEKLELDGRPLSADRQALVTMAEKRLPIYTANCDITIDNDRTPDFAAKEIWREYLESGFSKL